MIQNVDYLQGATIVTDPTNLVGEWMAIECISSLSDLAIVDNNLTSDSEPWTEDEFSKGMIRIGKFTEITAVGKVVLYA